MKFRDDQHNSINDINDLCFLNEPQILQFIKHNYNQYNYCIHFGNILLKCLQPSVMNADYNSSIIESSMEMDQNLESFMNKIISDNNAILSEYYFNANQYIDKYNVKNNNITNRLNELNCCNNNGNIINHSIMISGIRGSGKSTTYKQILFFLMNRNNTEKDLINKLLNAEIVIEAFSGYRINQQLNSSGFGKYLKLGLNQSNKVVNGYFDKLLLKTGLIIKRNSIETNFHIFYQLIYGSNAKDRVIRGLDFINSQNFRYLKHNLNIEETEYKINYERFKLSLNILKFDLNVINNIFDVLAGILHLGNLVFGIPNTKYDNYYYLKDDSKIHDIPTLQLISKLLGVSYELLEDVLITKSKLEIKNEVFKKSSSVEQSMSIRDSISKYLYQNVFNFVINEVNKNLDCQSGECIASYIGILDLVGFDQSESNGFEELCINYAAERFQNQFNIGMFCMELVEYEQQNIRYNEFVDNIPDIIISDSKSNICNQVYCLIEKSIFALLSDLFRLPNISVTKYLNNLNSNLSDNEYFRLDHVSHEHFKIKHYFGEVRYHAIDFILKNTESLSNDVLLLFANSTSPLLKAMYYSMESSLSSITSPNSSPNKTNNHLQINHSTMKIGTLCNKDLNSLFNHINTSIPHYIRCLHTFDVKKEKRNSIVQSKHSLSIGSSKSSNFNSHKTLEQLHINGILMISNVIRRQFFANFSLFNFYSRYKIVISKFSLQERFLSSTDLHEIQNEEEEISKLTNKLLERIYKMSYSWNIKLAKSKVYLNHQDHELLENIRSIALQKVTQVLSIYMLKYFAKILQIYRNRRIKYLLAVLTIQKQVRRWIAEKQFKIHLIEYKKWLENNKSALIANKIRLKRRIVLANRYNTYMKLQPDENFSLYNDIYHNKKLLYLREEKFLNTSIGRSNDSKHNEMIENDDSNQQEAFNIDEIKKKLRECCEKLPSTMELVNVLKFIEQTIDYSHLLIEPHRLIKTTLGINITKKIFCSNKINELSKTSKVFKRINKIKSSLLLVLELSKKEIHENLRIREISLINSSNISLSNDYLMVFNTINSLCETLDLYYDKYITELIELYGPESSYRLKFQNQTKYFIDLTNLLDKRIPIEKLAMKKVQPKIITSNIVSSKTSFDFIDINQSIRDIYIHNEFSYRRNPYYSGQDYVINCLFNLLQPRRLGFPSTFIQVDSIQNQKNLNKNYEIFEVSTNITSNNLLDMLNKDPIPIEKLDNISVSAMIICTILTGVIECNPENIIIKCKGGDICNLDPITMQESQYTIELVGYLSNQSYLNKIFNWNKSENIRLPILNSEIKNPRGFNVLYFLPQMDEPIDPEIVKLFTTGVGKGIHKADELICYWLQQIFQQNVHYQKLVMNGTLSEEDLCNLNLPIKLPLSIVLDIHHKLSQLQNYFKRNLNQSITNSELLCICYPEVGKYYENIRLTSSCKKELKFFNTEVIIPYHQLYRDCVRNNSNIPPMNSQKPEKVLSRINSLSSMRSVRYDNIYDVEEDYGVSSDLFLNLQYY